MTYVSWNVTYAEMHTENVAREGKGGGGGGGQNKIFQKFRGHLTYLY